MGYFEEATELAICTDLYDEMYGDVDPNDLEDTYANDEAISRGILGSAAGAVVAPAIRSRRTKRMERDLDFLSNKTSRTDQEAMRMTKLKKKLDRKATRKALLGAVVGGGLGYGSAQ